MNELTTSHQLFLGKDYSRRNTQEQLMEDEDGNNAWPVHLTIILTFGIPHQLMT